MDNSWYSFDISPIWVLVALIAALGVSILLYSKKKTPWSRTINILLGFLRFGAIFLLILLLVNPLLEYNTNKTEEPIIVIALDNSESIELRDSGTNLSALNKWLKSALSALEEEYLVRLEGITLDTVDATSKTTDLSTLLRGIETKYEHENLAGILLATDGIITKGQSPDYQNFGVPVYTLGLGDTIPPKDIIIQNVRNNKVAYQGNKFPVAVNVFQKGFNGSQVNLTIRENGQQISSQKVNLTSATHEVNFLLEAKTAGLRRFSVSIEEREGESSFENNRKDIYIDVVEGKDRILILAPSPHPDINAIRSVLEETENYETTLFIPGIQQIPDIKEYDLIIEHQAFSGVNYGDFKASGKWYIVGNRSRINLLNQAVNFLNIAQKGNQKDQVRGSYNSQFSKFKLIDESLDRMQNYPPISSPFGEYTVATPTEILLYQQIGSIVTNRPLWAFFDDGEQKTGILTGDGIWQWKLQESASNGDARLFNDLVLKTVQYLSIKVNKDRFIVKPRQADYQIGDQVILDTEVYNEIFERSYGNTIDLTITDQEGNIKTYQLIDNPANSYFKIGVLEPRIYTFKASTAVGGNKFFEQGSFAVRDIQIEGINLTANHNLLRRLSQNTGGKFEHFSNQSRLIDEIKEASYKSTISTSREKLPLIDSIWVILLIVGLLAVEWFLRKYLGAY
ncbi:MAG: hypothetical protein CMB80_33420 [Flammeovirgaceae bacterium]|nr:hypothetical protein [Flammeovirgaceae bacterium]|tara:strand:- start:5461 stop:7500 length:2040 start_codon:yes stop_codon:yes gene_type:complete